MTLAPDDPRHGTMAGRTAHYRAGEKPCEPCYQAQRAYYRKHAIVERRPYDEIDDIVVERILGGDWTIAWQATPAERRIICQQWATWDRQDPRPKTRPRRYSMRNLERFTGWRVDRYYTIKEAA